jgi:hypothetical protein
MVLVMLPSGIYPGTRYAYQEYSLSGQRKSSTCWSEEEKYQGQENSSVVAETCLYLHIHGQNMVPSFNLPCNNETHDSSLLRTMLNRLKKCGIDLAGSIFNADRGYDGEDKYKSVFGMHMLPNIKQRINARNKGKYSGNRKKVSKIFNISVIITDG